MSQQVDEGRWYCPKCHTGYSSILSVFENTSEEEKGKFRVKEAWCEFCEVPLVDEDQYVRIQRDRREMGGEGDQRWLVA